MLFRSGVAFWLVTQPWKRWSGCVVPGSAAPPAPPSLGSSASPSRPALSDGEGLHEPLGGCGEDLQDVVALLSRGRDDRSEERENPRALEGPEAAGDLHLDLHHPQILFGEIVGEGHVEVSEETQGFGFELLDRKSVV